MVSADAAQSAAPAGRATRVTLRDRKKAHTWHKILDAAREVFQETGFSQASLEQIATCAGVGKATLYRHVESKAELYVAILSRELRTFDEEMAQIISRCDTAAQKVEALGEWYLDAFTKPGFHLVHWALDNQDLIGEIPKAAIDQIQLHTRMRLRAFDTILREGIEAGEFVEFDSWLMANLLWRGVDAMVEFATSPARLELADRSPAQVFRQALHLALYGLRVR